MRDYQVRIEFSSAFVDVGVGAYDAESAMKEAFESLDDEAKENVMFIDII